MSDDSGDSRKGFASMPKGKVQEIASKGGQATAEKHGSEFYQEIGRKGGKANRKDEGRDEQEDEGNEE